MTILDTYNIPNDFNNVVDSSQVGLYVCVCVCVCVCVPCDDVIITGPMSL